MGNILITSEGKIIECPAGVEHHRVCRQKLHCDLDDFLLSNGGLRIKVYGEVAAFEFYGKLSNEQKAIIRRYLRKNDYYTVVLPNDAIKKFRPIRNIPLKIGG